MKQQWLLLLAGFLSIFVLTMISALVMPAHSATKWPSAVQLQRCEPWPKDAKLRRWCEHWSKRLP